jgi:hypothetical protein
MAKSVSLTVARDEVAHQTERLQRATARHDRAEQVLYVTRFATICAIALTIYFGVTTHERLASAHVPRIGPCPVLAWLPIADASHDLSVVFVSPNNWNKSATVPDGCPIGGTYVKRRDAFRGRFPIAISELTSANLWVCPFGKVRALTAPGADGPGTPCSRYPPGDDRDASGRTRAEGLSWGIGMMFVVVLACLCVQFRDVCADAHVFVAECTCMLNIARLAANASNV